MSFSCSKVEAALTNAHRLKPVPLNLRLTRDGGRHRIARKVNVETRNHCGTAFSALGPIFELGMGMQSPNPGEMPTCEFV